MKLIKYVLLLCFAASYGQAITVEDNGISKEELVAGLLDNSCVQITNVSQSDKEAVAYFNSNSGDFPISEGVIIRSGKAKLTSGHYTGQNLSSQINADIDVDLQSINNASGQSTKISDVAFLEFEFIPLSEKFSFDFIFASNEYGQWQCASSDVFAFLLTEVATGETKNIAVLPETTKPISVRTIKDNRFNDNCESDNPEFFDSYQVDSPNSVINMRGYTKVLTASAKIKAGKKYRIKLVIGDSNDSNYDSAILIAAGSFNTNLDLGADRVLCSGTFTRLNTGLEDLSYKHKWFYEDKEIPNETTHFIDVRETGKYRVEVVKNNINCDIEDQIVVKNLAYNDLPDIVVCDNGEKQQVFDLTKNAHEKLGLSSEQYDLVYFKGTANSTNKIDENNLTHFKSESGQTISVKLKSKETGEFCNAVATFRLLINESIQLDIPEEFLVCKAESSNEVDVTEIQQIVESQITSDTYRFNLFKTIGNANEGVNPIPDISKVVVPINSDEVQIFGRIQDTLVENCSNIFQVTLKVNKLPFVSELEDVVECSSYILPEIEFGDYYTQAEGKGRKLEAGDVIENSGTYYIYNVATTGCANQSSFKVELVKDYKLNEYYCDKFVVPTPPAGAFYDAPDGPNGYGQKINTGTVFKEDVSIYYYGEMEQGGVCKQEKFDISVLPLPEVEQLSNVVVCNGYILPELKKGAYYTSSNGGGYRLEGGTFIKSSIRLYIYNDDGNCSNESTFNISILPTFKDVYACGSYVLPEIEIGNYYDEDGKILQPGMVLTKSTSIIYSAETTDGSDCAKKVKFLVNISPIPEVSKLDDVLVCIENGYVLPELAFGQYFTKSGREGEELLPGITIYEDQEIFINHVQGYCASESSFKVEVRELAPVENFIDIYSCFGYELPDLESGKYFTQPNAKGKELAAGTYIQETQRIYIYNEWNDFEGCSNEKFFTVYIEGVRVDRPEAVTVCDSYILPKLQQGEYFTESGGKGQKISAGTEIKTSTTLYVYKKAGVRFICEDEYVFDIKVSKTPFVAKMPDIEVCGSYRVPGMYYTTGEGSASLDFEMFYTTDLEDTNARMRAGNIITEPGTYTMYLKAQSKSNKSCFNYCSFQVVVHPLQDLEIEKEALCVNTDNGEVEEGAYFYTGLDPNVFSVNWYYNGELVHTGVEYEAMKTGEYIIRTTKIDGKIETGCGYKETSVIVEESAKPEIEVSVTEPFEDVAVINANIVKGRGDYLYSLNGGEFQSSNQFYDVASGTYVLEVKPVMGYCGSTIMEVEVLKHPKFFTPNNDGFNDTWNIVELQSHPEAEVGIYDRYGSFITKIKPAEGGWNGAMGNKAMPSDDYWFHVEFNQEGVSKTYKSHFSLKR